MAPTRLQRVVKGWRATEATYHKFYSGFRGLPAMDILAASSTRGCMGLGLRPGLVFKV